MLVSLALAPPHHAFVPIQKRATTIRLKPRVLRVPETRMFNPSKIVKREVGRVVFFRNKKIRLDLLFFREERREDRDDDGRKRNVHKRRERNLSIDLAFEDDRGNRGVDR